MASARKNDESENIAPRRSSRNADKPAPNVPKAKSKPTAKEDKKASSASKEIKEAPQEKSESEEPKAKDVESAKRDAEESPEKPVKKAKKSKLSVGDTLGDISLDDDAGNSVSLLSVAKEHSIVLFSYPAASTPGCTTQACSYRDNYEKITSRGYKVYGISTDTVNAQSKFKSKQGFQYPLLSDPKKELLSVLGGSTNDKKTALRCHWVFKKGGELRAVEIGVKPKDCVDKAVESIDQIEKE